jgi:hypothetical protein
MPTVKQTCPDCNETYDYDEDNRVQTCSFHVDKRLTLFQLQKLWCSPDYDNHMKNEAPPEVKTVGDLGKLYSMPALVCCPSQRPGNDKPPSCHTANDSIEMIPRSLSGFEVDPGFRAMPLTPELVEFFVKQLSECMEASSWEEVAMTEAHKVIIDKCLLGLAKMGGLLGGNCKLGGAEGRRRVDLAIRWQGGEMRVEMKRPESGQSTFFTGNHPWSDKSPTMDSVPEDETVKPKPSANSGPSTTKGSQEILDQLSAYISKEGSFNVGFLFAPPTRIHVAACPPKLGGQRSPVIAISTNIVHCEYLLALAVSPV